MSHAGKYTDALLEPFWNGFRPNPRKRLPAFQSSMYIWPEDGKLVHVQVTVPKVFFGQYEPLPGQVITVEGAPATVKYCPFAEILTPDGQNRRNR